MKQFLFCLFISLSVFAYSQNDLTFSLQKNAIVTKNLLLESTETIDKPIPITVEMKWVKDDLLEITFISQTKVEPYTKLYFFNAENDFKNLKIGYPTSWAPKKFIKSLQKKKIQQFDEVKGATRLEKETQTMFVGDGKVTYRYNFSPQESSLLFKFKVYVSSNTPKGQKYDTKMEFESKFLPLIVKLETDCDKYRNKITELKNKIETVETLRANYEANRTESNYNDLIAYQKERIEDNVICADLKDFALKYNELLDNIYPPVSTRKQEGSGSGGSGDDTRATPSQCAELEQTLKASIQELEVLRKASRRGEDVTARLENVRKKYDGAYQAADGTCKSRTQKLYNSCQDGYNYLKRK